MAVVFCDIDGVLRGRKGEPVSPDTYEEIMSFRGDGGIFNMITGAPLAHVPTIPAHMIFAEAGGVRIMPEQSGMYVFEQGRTAILELRDRLAIFQEDGIVETPFGSLIVEGPRRFTSLTLLFGYPPHYPGYVTSAKMEEINAWIDELVRELSLTLSLGHDTTYSYSDIFSLTKRQAVAIAMGEAGWERAYFLGDKHPDLEAMLLPGIVPVGFSNSIEEIRILARERGVYIDLPGPTGGVAEFFRQLNNGHI